MSASETRNCRQKVRHSSLERALRCLAKMQRTGRARQGDLQPYECRFCHGWHLGHPQPRHLKIQPIRGKA